MAKSNYAPMQLAAVCAMAMLFVVLMGKSANAQCSDTLVPDTCQFGTNRLNVFPGTISYTTCSNVNKNPFSVPPIFGAAGLSANQCETVAREDGQACIQFYARVQCSGACEKCAVGICPNFCDNYQTTCPTATALGCFDFITCADSATSCTKWDVSGNLPSPATTTTTRTTTSSHTGTSSTHTTTTSDSSDASSFRAGAGMIIFFLAFFFA